MGTSLRARRFATLAAVVAVAAALFTAAPATAAPPASAAVPYAALGDSYAAGFGAGGPYDGCGRSLDGYPRRLDGIAHVQLVAIAACSGATVEDVWTNQVPILTPAVKLVTLTVGANDVGFDALHICYDPATLAQCQEALGVAAVKIQSGAIAALISETVAAIHASSPAARILITGYPPLFALPSEYGPLAATVDQLVAGLNANIQAGATAAGATYVDVSGRFAGHAIGSTVPWIHDYSPALDNADAFHPNAAGYKAYANALKPYVG